eukprot:5019798-Karenia_brevis.AAC.1
MDLSTLLARSGMPPHPGPVQKHEITIGVQNISTLSTYLPDLMSKQFDICFLQETSIPKTSFVDAYNLVKDFKSKSFLTPTDPECIKPTGGLGAIFRNGIKIVKIQPLTKDFQELQNGGRVQLIAIVLPNDVIILVANMYCWTNGHTVSSSACRSDHLISTILDEFASQPPGHRLIVGDLNADVADIPSLKHAVDCGDFIDVGATP